MTDTPTPQKTAQRKIRGHIESFITTAGKEDSMNRVVGSLVNGHSPDNVEIVFQAYHESWSANPDVNDEKLTQLKNEIRSEWPGVEI